MGDKVERIMLEDGRRAERHTSVDASGAEVVELYTEEPRPLKLERRIVSKKKEVISSQRVETIKNGEVVDVVDHDVELPRLQLVDHISKADRPELYGSDHVTRQEVAEAVAQSVVAAVQALRVSQNSVPAEVPAFTAQSVVASRVEESGKGDRKYLILYLVLIVVQLGFLMWVLFGDSGSGSGSGW